MTMNRTNTSLIAGQVNATLRQARQMEEVADSFVRFGTSLIRLPILLCQSLALLFALPFVGMQALTGILDRGAERVDRAVDTRLAKVSKPKPMMLPRPSTGATLRAA